jgi:hypothetical protein
MLRIARAQPLTTKLYAAGRFYYRLYVFRNVDELRAFGNEQVRLMEFRDRRFLATCYGYAMHYGRGGLPRRKCQIGVIALCRDGLNTYVASHEFTHAALYAVKGNRRWPVRLTRRDDETIAVIQGGLMSQFDEWLKRQTRRRRRRNGP